MDRVHYEVDGIINQNMKTALKNALQKIDGVETVDVNLGDQSIDIKCSNITNQIVVKRCIEKSGAKINSFFK